MGRRNKAYFKDLHQQAYDRLTGMQAFGESKKEAVANGTEKDKIFAFNTYKSYWKHTKYFIKYIKEKHPECTTLKSAKKYAKVKLWETIIQSPYSVEFAESVVRKQIEDEMFPEGKEWLIAKIGITGKYNGSYEKMREAMEQNPEDSFYSGNVVIARQQRLKRNFRSKYWEVAIVHTKPLGDVPEDLMPEVKKPVQGT